MARLSRKVKSFFFVLFFVNTSTFDHFIGSASMTPSLLQARIKWTN